MTLNARVLEAGVGVPQFIEERMSHGLDGGQTLGRSVLQQSSNQIDRLVRSLAENLAAKSVFDDQTRSG